MKCYKVQINLWECIVFIKEKLYIMQLLMLFCHLLKNKL